MLVRPVHFGHHVLETALASVETSAVSFGLATGLDHNLLPLAPTYNTSGVGFVKQHVQDNWKSGNTSTASSIAPNMNTPANTPYMPSPHMYNYGQPMNMIANGQQQPRYY
jgi:hypothetical protein